MLSNAYFLAKFRFDTAKNEPAKNLQNLPMLPHLRRRGARRRGDPREAPEGRGAHRPRPARVPRRELALLRRYPLGGSIGREERLVLGCIEAKFCK